MEKSRRWFLRGTTAAISFGGGTKVGSRAVRADTIIERRNKAGQATAATASNPVARFDYRPEFPTAGEKITFDAGPSSDPDGDIEYYQWDWQLGGYDVRTTQEETEHVFESAGRKAVKLQVVDSRGGADQETKFLKVQPAETPTPTPTDTPTPTPTDTPTPTPTDTPTPTPTDTPTSIAADRQGPTPLVTPKVFGIGIAGLIAAAGLFRWVRSNNSDDTPGPPTVPDTPSTTGPGQQQETSDNTDTFVESSRGGRDLEDIAGVNASKADALREAGYESVDDLNEADQTTIAEVEGIGTALASRIKADLGETDADQTTGETSTTTSEDASHDRVSETEEDDQRDSTGAESDSSNDAETQQTVSGAADSGETNPAEALIESISGLSGGEVVDDEGPVHIYSAQEATERDLGRGADVIARREDQNPVLVYALAPEVAGEEAAATAFDDAASTWNGISHNDHIATVSSVGKSPRSWVSFDCGACTLAEAHDDFEAEELVELLISLIDAFEKARLYKVSHGYIRPQTVHLASTDFSTAKESISLSDWGITPAVHDALDDKLVSTYCAPEQFQENQGADPRTDVYQLGALTYWAVTGRHLFDYASDIEEAVLNNTLTPPMEHADISTELNDAIMTALERDPADRYESPLTFQTELQASRD